MPLRNKWFGLLRARAPRRQFGHSAVVDLTLYYFNKVASHNYKKKS